MVNVNKDEGDSVLLSLDIKEANLTNADEFKAEMIQLFGYYHKKMILDLGQVEYIDSSFLGALVALLKYLISYQSDIILVGLRKDIADLFALIRLDKVFKIYHTFDEALNQ